MLYGPSLSLSLAQDLLWLSLEVLEATRNSKEDGRRRSLFLERFSVLKYVTGKSSAWATPTLEYEFIHSFIVLFLQLVSTWPSPACLCFSTLFFSYSVKCV